MPGQGIYQSIYHLRNTCFIIKKFFQYDHQYCAPNDTNVCFSSRKPLFLIVMEIDFHHSFPLHKYHPLLHLKCREKKMRK